MKWHFVYKCVCARAFCDVAEGPLLINKGVVDWELAAFQREKKKENKPLLEETRCSVSGGEDQRKQHN